MRRASAKVWLSSSVAAAVAALGLTALSGACASTNSPGGTAVQVVLLPKSVTLLPSGSQQFVAFGLSAQGDTLAVSATYTATGGTISAAGLYTADTVPGQYWAYAEESGSGLKDSSTIVINPSAVLASVEIQPKSVALQPGQSQQFVAYGLSTQGDTMGVTITYTATGGTITGAGLYTAGNTGGQYWAYAAGGGFKDSAAVTISTASGGGTWPNEPAGTTTLIDYGMGDALPSPSGSFGTGTTWNVYNNPGISLATDNTAPVSPSNVWAVFYPQGFGPGSAPATVNWGPNIPSNAQRLYIAFYIKFSSPWTPAPANAQKLIYLWDGGATKNFTLQATRMVSQDNIMNPQTGTSNFGPNVGSFDPYSHLNQWLLYEWKLDAVAGTIDWWVNGTKVASYTGVSGWPSQWSIFSIYPGYGGNGSPPAQDQWLWIDHVYVSTW